MSCLVFALHFSFDVRMYADPYFGVLRRVARIHPLAQDIIISVLYFLPPTAMMDGDGFGAGDEALLHPFRLMIGPNISCISLWLVTECSQAIYQATRLCRVHDLLIRGAGSHTWQVERRWSNVRALYYELWNKWKPSSSARRLWMLRHLALFTMPTDLVHGSWTQY